jgi:hypothetical protein
MFEAGDYAINLFRKSYCIEKGLILPIEGSKEERYFPFDHYYPNNPAESLWMLLVRLNIEREKNILSFVNKFGLLTTKAKLEGSEPESESVDDFRGEARLLLFLLKLIPAIRKKESSSLSTLWADNVSLLSRIFESPEAQQTLTELTIGHMLSDGICEIRDPGNTSLAVPDDGKMVRVGVDISASIPDVVRTIIVQTLRGKMKADEPISKALVSALFERILKNVYPTVLVEPEGQMQTLICYDTLIEVIYIMVWLWLEGNKNRMWSVDRCPACNKNFIKTRDDKIYDTRKCTLLAAQRRHREKEKNPKPQQKEKK